MAAVQFTQLGARRLEAVLVEIDGGDMGAGPGEINGDGAADATAATRHHANAA